MFCNNCGSKLPEGARFCNNCGAKVEVVAAEKKTSYVDNMSFARDVEPKKTPVTRNTVSFDWSGVIDESHKREIPRVQSPWGNTGLEEEHTANTERIVSAPKQTRYTDDDIFEDINKPSESPSRTMSFMDVLKAEKEEKARAAAEASEPLTERVAPTADYSAFDNADGFAFENEILPKREREMTQGYTDLRTNLVDDINTIDEVAPQKRYATPIQEEEDIASSYLDDAPSFEQAFSYDDEDEDFDEPVAPRRYATPIDEVEETPVRESRVERAATPEPEVEDLYLGKEEDNSDLDAQLAAILGGTAVAAAAPVVEPVAEPVVEAVAETPAPAANSESEVEALKRRLAELMGETNEVPEPVVKHETPSMEELFADEPEEETVELADFEKPDFVAPEAQPVTAAPEDGADIFAMFDDDAVEAAAVASTVAAAEVSEVSEPVADEPVVAEPSSETDAMSLDDLEKDLFGDGFGEDAEAEATKKIDKFYTLYKKNEEFQKLLDEEYNKLQGEDVDALLAQQQPVAQMSMPAAAAALQEVAPQPVPQPVQQVAPQPEPVVFQQVAPQPVQQPQPEQFQAPADQQLSKKELRAQKKAAKKANKPVVDDDEDEGGNVLTIIAVVIAVLLVILLGVILILNFAPDSGLGMALDSFIQNITSHFSALDGFNDEFLL